MPKLTAVLGVGLLAAATFLGGIEAQKQWGGGSSSGVGGNGFAARLAGSVRSAVPTAHPPDLPETAGMTAALFTIGYERRTQAELVTELSAAGVTLLADVRELPLSRRKGFSKTALAEAVETGGIEYRHLRPLGNPKPARDAWKRGDAVAGIAGYEAHLHGVPDDVAALAERVAEGGVCLLCVEHDPASCHRTLLAGALRRALGELDVRNL